MSRESRWFWIPAIFGLSMFVALILWWLPAALARPNGGLGVGQVIAGDMVLAWKAFLRCVVPYVVTIVALKWLPPIYWWQAFIVAAAALVVEIFAEVVTAIYWRQRGLDMAARCHCNWVLRHSGRQHRLC
jgi:hypothetical protein